MSAASPEVPLASRLARLLGQPLPGRTAHRTAWPETLPGRLDPPDAAEYGAAAVLIALYAHPDRTGRYLFPLIRRPEGIEHHSGQIALPGGRCDGGEESCDCARREAEEEIGLPRDAVRILGALTPVPVAVSRNRIQPVVGWIDEARRPARWRAQAGEVDSILSADPDALAAQGPRPSPVRWRDGLERTVPAWIIPADAGAAVVWGATAIILAEFLTIWRQARAGAEPGPAEPA